MIRLTKKQLLLLHSQLIKVYGGRDGIRGEKLLEYALESPFQSFGGRKKGLYRYFALADRTSEIRSDNEY